NERAVSLHSLLDADFYREGARVTPAPRRRSQRRARRRLTPAPWLVPVTPDVRRRIAVIQREWQRVDPRFLDDDEQRYWATIAGRQIRFDERASFVQKLTEGRASSEYPEAKRLLGALANSRGHRHEENAARLVKTSLEQPINIGAALLASAEGYTPRATKLIEEARELLGPTNEVALALSEN